MSEIKQYRVNDDGMTCRAVNPYSGIMPEHEEFELSTPRYRLSERQIVSTVIYGKLAFRQREIGTDTWTIIPESEINSYDLMFHEVEVVVEPVTPSKEVKEDEQDIATCLEAFIDSCYKGCSKDELNQLRINAEKALKNYKR